MEFNKIEITTNLTIILDTTATQQEGFDGTSSGFTHNVTVSIKGEKFNVGYLYQADKPIFDGHYFLFSKQDADGNANGTVCINEIDVESATLKVLAYCFSC